MSGTQVVAVRSTLLNSIANLPEFTDAKVSMGWALGDKSREKVYSGNTQFSHSPASIKSGRTFREETATFDVVVRVEGIALTQEETSERAVELGTLIEEYVADHRSDFAPGVKWILVQGPGRLDEMFNERGTLAELTYTVAYNARLE